MLLSRCTNEFVGIQHSYTPPPLQYCVSAPLFCFAHSTLIPPPPLLPYCNFLRANSSRNEFLLLRHPPPLPPPPRRRRLPPPPPSPLSLPQDPIKACTNPLLSIAFPDRAWLLLLLLFLKTT